MEEEDDSNWDFLLPWCHQVSHRLRYAKGALEDAPGQRYRGIEVELPRFELYRDADEQQRDSKPPCQDLREALALLAAVAHVDNAAWKKLLVENGKLNVGNQEEMFEGDFMPRFQLTRLDCGLDGSGELLEGVSAFCGTEQYSVQSAEYQRALTRIAAMKGGRSCTGSTEIEIPITVQLGPWLAPSSQEMLVYLRKLQATVRTARTQWHQYVDRGQTRLSAVFVLESIMIDLRDASISTELAQLVESLAHDGITVSGLALRLELGYQLSANGSLEEARKTVGKLMFGLFGGAKKAAALDWSGLDFEIASMTGPLAAEYGHINQLGLSSVHFDCETMQNWVFERMCSAVALNQTARHLSLGLELNDGDSDGEDWALWCWRWQWVIFACFSEKARLQSRLEKLTLRNAVITAEAVEAMAAVSASHEPEEDLLSCSSLPSAPSIDVCIMPNSPLKLLSIYPDDDADNSPSFKVEREIAGVRLLREADESNWVDALVPGFGKCKVQHASLIYRELTLPSNGLAGVTSLEIKFGEDPDPEVLQGLLLLVGASLTHLTLEFEYFNTMDLQGIVASCPNLVELAVCTHIIELRFCLRDSNYRDLALDPTSHFPFARVEDIAHILCDSENPFTKCARRVRVRLDQRAVYHPYEACYAALLQMLEMNCSLEYLDIVAQRLHMTHYNDFKMHHLESLPVVQSALSMTCKAAFLSVMGAKRSERRDTKRRRQLPLPVLDQHVLVCVFEYAAPHVTRRVYFREHDFFETGRYYIPI
ncbi:hypothetical protein PHYPSEUDO_014935 [Phytophthora pseudosyringae]|uniref:Uncharacterized protein n=1 Tax=Phytophthora pseudosyringae TaxID=221518 RepID=A0A8T1W0S0_9STRA|nr:hypothetical protein PHYPSEUDO_014935 [Phytophthora pseudosyringae]